MNQIRLRWKCRWLSCILAALAIAGCDDRPVEDLVDPLSERLLTEANEALFQHEFRRALVLMDSVEARSPNLSHMHFMRGRIFSELGRFEEAEESYRKAARLRPDYRGVWNNLANNAVRQEEYEKAISYFQREFELNPAPIPLRGMGRAYEELGRVEEAQRAFQRAIAFDSTYIPAYLSLAMLHENEGEVETALGYARQALRMDSNHVDHRYRVGSLLVQAGRFEEGAEHLRVVVEEWPWYHGGHYSLGQALARMGREEEATDRLEEAERVRARSARIEHLENTVRAMPNDATSYAALGFEYRRAGRFNDAMHAYKIALHHAPTDDAIQNNIANLHLIRGDTLAAINQYHTILRQDASLTDIWVNLGIVYAISGKTSEARQAWLNALRLEPDHRAARSYITRLENGN